MTCLGGELMIVAERVLWKVYIVAGWRVNLCLGGCDGSSIGSNAVQILLVILN